MYNYIMCTTYNYDRHYKYYIYCILNIFIKCYANNNKDDTVIITNIIFVSYEMDI